MDYTHITFLLGTLILIIVFYVAISPPVKESFTTTAEQPLTQFNTCGKNILFLKAGVNRASSRAVRYENANLSNISNIVPISTDGSHTDHETYSIVKDNFIFYTFRKDEYDIRYKELISNPATSTVTFRFNLNDEIGLSFRENTTKMVLSRPLYVEFVKNVDESIAYLPIFNTQGSEGGRLFRYTNYDLHHTLVSRGNVLSIQNLNTSDMSLTFEPVLPKDAMRISIGGLFNYGIDAKTVSDLKLPANKSQTKVICYFLDDKIPLSLQNVGKMMSRGDANLFDENSAEPVREIVVFDKDYAKKFQNNTNFKSQANYEFNNNINVFFRNFIVPTFSFNFDIVLSEIAPNNNTMVANMYMNNNFGSYSYCSDVIDMPKNNNIFSLIAESGSAESNAVNLVLTTGRGSSCNYPVSDGSGIAITVPKFINGKIIKVIVMVSPNEKIIAAFWNETDRTTQQFVTYGRSTHCANDLNFWKLFKEGEMTGNQRTINIENIILARNPKLLKACRYVKLGHVNLLNEYV
jgi:hypothetical protein